LEQQKSVVYEFRCLAEIGGQDTKPFSVRINAPTKSSAGDYATTVSCPYLRTKSFSIYGIDSEQALTLALRFIERSLEHLNVRLVDSEGRTVALPSIET
jgi:hypothetical protein